MLQYRAGPAIVAETSISSRTLRLESVPAATTRVSIIGSGTNMMTMETLYAIVVLCGKQASVTMTKISDDKGHPCRTPESAQNA